jgi:hypothetical protein
MDVSHVARGHFKRKQDKHNVKHVEKEHTMVAKRPRNVRYVVQVLIPRRMVRLYVVAVMWVPPKVQMGPLRVTHVHQVHRNLPLRNRLVHLVHLVSIRTQVPRPNVPLVLRVIFKVAKVALRVTNVKWVNICLRKGRSNVPHVRLARGKIKMGRCNVNHVLSANSCRTLGPHNVVIVVQVLIPLLWVAAFVIRVQSVHLPRSMEVNNVPHVHRGRMKHYKAHPCVVNVTVAQRIPRLVNPFVRIVYLALFRIPLV